MLTALDEGVPLICSVLFLAWKGGTGMETVSGTGRIWLQGEPNLLCREIFGFLLAEEKLRQEGSIPQ